MTKTEATNVIIKFLTQEANVNELKELSSWLDNPKNEQYFCHFIKTNYTIDYAVNEYNKDELKQLLLKQIKKDKSFLFKHRMKSGLKYAAIAIAFLGIGYFFKQYSTPSTQQVLIPKQESVVLELENGETEILNTVDTKVVTNTDGQILVKQNKNQISYTNTSLSSSKTIVYNTIRVPNGKQFELALSDGTKVFLNAGTTLRYPVIFLKGYDREVFLSGEAYFEVTHNEKQPFIVNTKEINTRVLGTKFNISSYKDDTQNTTILIEGKVGVYKNTKEYSLENASIIQPGYGVIWNKQQQALTVKKVNTDLYISWLQGKLIFRGDSFKNIRRKLERQYNITIINNNLALEDEKYNATFDIENIEQVLRIFEESFSLEYEINNNQIIIN